MDKLSYALGMGIGQQLLGMGGKDINVDDFAKALRDILSESEPALTGQEAQNLVTAFLQEQESKKEAENKEKGKIMLEAGEKFLAENAKKEGIITLESGLQYEIIKEVEGKKPTASDQVKCHYEGTLIDGTIFDSSYKRNSPATFPLNGVISGWTEGVQLMSEGSKYRFYIPYNLAYGERGAGNAIPPFSTLIFDIELLEVL